MLNRIENAFSILLERSTIISRKVKTFVCDTRLCREVVPTERLGTTRVTG